MPEVLTELPQILERLVQINFRILNPRGNLLVSSPMQGRITELIAPRRHYIGPQEDVPLHFAYKVQQKEDGGAGVDLITSIGTTSQDGIRVKFTNGEDVRIYFKNEHLPQNVSYDIVPAELYWDRLMKQ